MNVLPGVYTVDSSSTLSTIHISVEQSHTLSSPVVFQGVEWNECERAHIQAVSSQLEPCIAVEYSTHNVVIQNFHFSNATGNSYYGHTPGVKIAGTNVTVRYNNIYGCQIGIFVRQSNPEDTIFGARIYGNVISDCGEAGIRIKGSVDNQIYANLLYHNGEWEEPAGGITIYRTINTQVFNNTIITSRAPGIHLYRGTDPNSEPCVHCGIFDNICLKNDPGISPIFAVDYTMAQIQSNRFHHNTWFNQSGSVCFSFGGFDGRPLQRFSQYRSALPANGVNGRGEEVREPNLGESYLLTVFSREIDSGSRSVSEAGLKYYTGVQTQSFDRGRVDRGYHQLLYAHRLNPAWQRPSQTSYGHQPLSLKEISFNAGESIIKKASLYDILGRRVALLNTVSFAKMPETANSLNLSNGFYVLRVETDREMQSVKMIIIR